MKIAVIGAGLGGLAISCLLTTDGHEVSVFEMNMKVGGKMNQIRSQGFRFDTGPSLLTMPDLLSKIFEQCSARLNDYLTIQPLDPLCRYFYPDGTVFDNFQDQEKTIIEIRKFAPEDETAYREFLAYSEDLYHKTADSFLYNPLYNLSDLRGISLLDFLGIDAFSTQSERIDNKFKSDYLRKFFKRFATYNGSSPFQAPATLNVIPHVEITMGGYYVNGGIYQIAKALEQLGRSLGVTFNFSTEVTGITTKRAAATGIQFTDGGRFDADLIISNSDSYETYLNLLDNTVTSSLKRRMISRAEPSCSGFVLLLGLDRQYAQLRHHNVLFSNNYEAEFTSIFKEKHPPDDPTIYIANTSYTEPYHAIPGGSNLFVLVNAPYLSEQYDWNKSKTDYAKLVIEVLEKRGLSDLSDAIQFKQTITPLDFYKKYLSNRGSIYGTSSNSRLSAFMRPKNKARNIDGLYLVGGSTHPGGGIPLVLLSAGNAYKLIQRFE